MLQYTAFSAIVFLSIYISGLLVVALVDAKKIHRYGLLPIYLIGFVVLSILSSYLSLFIALGNYVILGVLSILVCGIFFFRKSIFNHLNTLKSLSRADLFCISFLILIVVFLSSRGIYNYDSGLYHVQSIKWIQTYPVVPGLGNLHGRLAFNSMYFPISSIFSLNTANWQIYPLNSITLVVFMIWQYFKFKDFVKSKDVKGIGFILSILLLLFTQFGDWFSSPSPDVICAVLCLALLQLLIETPSGESNRLLVISLIFLLISYKLSVITLAFLTILYIDRSTLTKDLFRIGSLACIILLQFIIRNYKQSGYLIYTLYEIDLFNPDWKIPLNKVINEQSWIKSWAIEPGAHFSEVLQLAFIEWFPDWFSRQQLIFKIILTINILSAPIVVFLLWIEKEFQTFQIFMILLISMSFWLYNAPDPRFILGILVFTFVYLLFLMTTLFNNKIIKLLSLACLIGIIPFFTWKSFKEKMTISFDIYKNDKSLLIKAAGFADHPPLYEKKIENFEFYTPINGDRCFNCDIPCTPYTNRDLIMRGHDLSKGFKIRASSQASQ